MQYITIFMGRYDINEFLQIDPNDTEALRQHTEYLEGIIEQGFNPQDPDQNTLVGAIFERFFPDLVVDMFLYTNFDIHRAEEVAAMTMVALLGQVRENKLPSYNIKYVFNWLIKVGRRKNIDLFRHEHRVRYLDEEQRINVLSLDQMIETARRDLVDTDLDEDTDETELVGIVRTIPEVVIKEAISEGKVDEILSGLNENLRNVMMLRFIQGLTPQEIGTAEGVEAGVIHNRIYRARKELAGKIDI
jgi:RNA polymerase sigma factor (sigma-70 family)